MVVTELFKCLWTHLMAFFGLFHLLSFQKTLTFVETIGFHFIDLNWEEPLETDYVIWKFLEKLLLYTSRQLAENCWRFQMKRSSAVAQKQHLYCIKMTAYSCFEILQAPHRTEPCPFKITILLLGQELKALLPGSPLWSYYWKIIVGWLKFNCSTCTIIAYFLDLNLSGRPRSKSRVLKC